MIEVLVIVVCLGSVIAVGSLALNALDRSLKQSGKKPSQVFDKE